MYRVALRMGAEVRLVVVQERRLHVGVHNGLGWVDGPQVMVLEPSSGGSGGLKESSTETYSAVLMLRGNMELRMIRHPAFSLVFQLEYVFSVPIAGDRKIVYIGEIKSTSQLPGIL
ncbi:hypothetical protein QTP86_012964 [Hemibagrus guttatus]|nr:hypothetical protein QTP86_012964 [Hemibagrus guttatus]